MVWCSAKIQGQLYFDLIPVADIITESLPSDLVNGTTFLEFFFASG